MIDYLFMIVYNILSKLYEILFKSYVKRSVFSLNKRLVGGGKKRVIAWPYIIKGVENLFFSDNVNIGPGATIYSTAAKLIIKEHVIIGPNLTIITGDHMPIIGRYIDTVTAGEKQPEYDQNVIIESNVWIGCNVTILKGVTIGRGSIVAAGAVVAKSCPPYSVIGGVPAKIIKSVFSEEEIKEHERLLENQK